MKNNFGSLITFILSSLLLLVLICATENMGNQSLIQNFYFLSFNCHTFFGRRCLSMCSRSTMSIWNQLFLRVIWKMLRSRATMLWYGMCLAVKINVRTYLQNTFLPAVTLKQSVSSLCKLSPQMFSPDLDQLSKNVEIKLFGDKYLGKFRNLVLPK